MEDAAGAHNRELTSIRTGRAHPSLVENIRVDLQGAVLNLIQLATISAPESRLIVIQPWDQATVNSIAKSIQQSDLGLNPQIDGTTIRIPIPELTADRRREMAKLVNRKNEEGHIEVRNIRRDIQNQLRSMVKSKDISQDEERRAHEQLEKATRTFVDTIDKAGSEKERELLET
jgi:ribosome recycling factor